MLINFRQTLLKVLLCLKLAVNTQLLQGPFQINTVLFSSYYWNCFSSVELTS